MISFKKVVYVLREKKKGLVSDRQIWRGVKISKSSFYRILKCYSRLPGKELILAYKGRPKGRPRKEISLEIAKKVLLTRLKTHTNEKVISTILKKEENLSVSHRKVYELLKSAGLIHMFKKSRRKKPWVRWQRKHSLSLWQTDWTHFEDKWLMVIMDDASRNVVSWGLFEHATTENSIAVLKKGIETYGKPKAMLTGRDVQFYCSTKKGKSAGKNDFQKFLEVNGIQHILARVNHPQTCGKIERFFGEVKKRIHTWNDFKTIEEVVHWHNTIKPHMSLSHGEELVTPQLAFQKKTHHNAKIINSYKEVKENE